MKQSTGLAVLISAGLLLPVVGTAQVPIQADPQADGHVLRLPPTYSPNGNPASYGAAPQRYDPSGAPQQRYDPSSAPPQRYDPSGAPPQRYDNVQYGAPQNGAPPVQSPQLSPPPANGPAPRYGGSLLGSPGGQLPGYPPAAAGGAPRYGAGQAAMPGYGNQAPPGTSVPPVQSPRYDSQAGSQGTNGTQGDPYSSRDDGSGFYGSQGGSITQEQLAPLPSTHPPGPAQTSGQQQPPLQGSAPLTAPQGTAPAQLATPQSPTGQDVPAGAAPGPADGQKAAIATPAPELPNVWLPAGVAKLQALDKVNAQASTLTVKVGQSATFGSLTITVKSCVIRPSDQPADAAAFVDVTDSHPDSTGFSGWLLENEPSVSIMQHPIYDLRVAGCA